MARKYQAVLFDLLTALIDSWSLWNETAGSVEMGREWRAEYLRLTYGCGAYRAYEDLVAEAAESVGLGRKCADRLESNWARLAPWPEAGPQAVSAGARRVGCHRGSYSLCLGFRVRSFRNVQGWPGHLLAQSSRDGGTRRSAASHDPAANAIRSSRHRPSCCRSIVEWSE